MLALLLVAGSVGLNSLVVGFALGAYRAPLLPSVAIIAIVGVGLAFLTGLL